MMHFWAKKMKTYHDFSEDDSNSHSRHSQNGAQDSSSRPQSYFDATTTTTNASSITMNPSSRRLPTSSASLSSAVLSGDRGIPVLQEHCLLVDSNRVRRRRSRTDAFKSSPNHDDRNFATLAATANDNADEANTSVSVSQNMIAKNDRLRENTIGNNDDERCLNVHNHRYEDNDKDDCIIVDDTDDEEDVNNDENCEPRRENRHHPRNEPMFMLDHDDESSCMSSSSSTISCCGGSGSSRQVSYDEDDEENFSVNECDTSLQNQLITLTKGVSLTSSALVPSQSQSTSASNDSPLGLDEVDGSPSNPMRLATMPELEFIDNPSFKQFRSLDFQCRFENIFTTFPDNVQSPLPKFNWANSKDVWSNMMKKELTYQRDCGMFKNHPELQPRMRSILLDWLSEVCEVYRLHKETFSLAVDFIDRYLSITSDVAKTQLQLTGITSLFIAAKLEEIYPPKLGEFAYVTDSACSETDIIRQEMIMLKALKWDLSPLTTNSWLSVYLQMANLENISNPEMGFVFPQFSTHAFIQISRLCDLCTLDVNSLKYRYSVIAAAALYHHTNEQLVMEVSGLNWADLYPCIKWMTPFAKAILEIGQCPVKFFPHISAEDCHNIQSHNVDMQLVDRALALQSVYQEQEKKAPSSLDFSAQLVELLTPPCDNISPNSLETEATLSSTSTSSSS